MASTKNGKERLLILGSGWAGFSLARSVNKKLFDVTVASPSPYFTFTPLLATAAVNTIDLSCALEPVRALPGVRFAQVRARDIDFRAKNVDVEPATDAGLIDRTGKSTASPLSVSYDKLVIAVGCASNDFGTPGHAVFLKDIHDARRIRNRLLECLEQASLPGTSEDERKALLAVRIVGGGPTGVELAAELHDFIKEDGPRLYADVYQNVSITVYDVAPQILQSFDHHLQQYAVEHFRREGVKVEVKAKVSAIHDGFLEVNGDKLPFGLLVWSTGTQANPFIKSLKGVSKEEKTESIKVDDQLRVLDGEGSVMPDVYAIGDNTLVTTQGRLPATGQGLMPVAEQQSQFLAAALNSGKVNRNGFAWQQKGSAALLGEHEGIMQDESKRDSAGSTAWVAWRVSNVRFSYGWRNTVMIPFQWAMDRCFGRHVTSV